MIELLSSISRAALHAIFMVNFSGALKISIDKMTEDDVYDKFLFMLVSFSLSDMKIYMV